jgi:F-type H+-transporting ATPase subunit delta
MEKLVANRYAEALFSVGLELNLLDKIKEAMTLSSSVLSENEDYYKLLKHPRISKTEKKEMLAEVFKDKLPQEVLNLFFILVDRGRLPYIPMISEQYVEFYNEEKNIIVAEAYTSVLLTDSQLKTITSKLEEELNATVQINNIVDESILGGIKLVYNNQIVDNSVASKLSRLKDDLYNVKL